LCFRDKEIRREWVHVLCRGKKGKWNLVFILKKRRGKKTGVGEKRSAGKTVIERSQKDEKLLKKKKKIYVKKERHLRHQVEKAGGNQKKNEEPGRKTKFPEKNGGLNISGRERNQRA